MGLLKWVACWGNATSITDQAMGLKVWSGTLLPIYGWRTYNDKRDAMRQEFNEWLRYQTE